MTNKQLEKLNQKFRDGDGLSNKDLSTLIDLYKAMVEGLEVLGCEFYLATKEARSRLYSLESFKFARDNRG